MPDLNPPGGQIPGPVPVFFPPFPNEEQMRRGRLNADVPLGNLDETRSVKKRRRLYSFGSMYLHASLTSLRFSEASPSPVAEPQHAPGANPYRHEIRAQPTFFGDLDLDLNPDLL